MAPDEVLRVRTADNVVIRHVTAGIGSRAIAVGLDYVIQAPLIIAVVLGYLAAGRFATTAEGLTFAALGAVLLAFFIDVVYFVVAEGVTAGRSPGKRAAGLRVLREDGGAIGLPESAVRNLVRVVDTLGGIGLVVMFCNAHARRLGDFAAGTVVVRERGGAAPPPAPLRLATPSPGDPLPGIEHLGQRELAAVRELLSRQGLPPGQRAALAAQIAARLCDRMQLTQGSALRAVPAELLLEQLYLQLSARLSSP